MGRDLVPRQGPHGFEKTSIVGRIPDVETDARDRSSMDAHQDVGSTGDQWLAVDGATARLLRGDRSDPLQQVDIDNLAGFMLPTR
jgi:hypothetical protein